MAVTIDPIEQFELKPLVSLGHIGHQELAFTPVSYTHLTLPTKA